MEDMKSGVFVSIQVKGLDGYIEKLEKLRDLVEDLNHEALELNVSYGRSLDSTNSDKAVSYMESQD